MGLCKGSVCGEAPLCLTVLFPWAGLSSLSLPPPTLSLHPEMTRFYHCHAWRCVLSMGSALLLKSMDTGGSASLSWLFSQDSLTHQPAFSAFGYVFFLVGCGSKPWSLSFLGLVKKKCHACLPKRREQRISRFTSDSSRISAQAQFSILPQFLLCTILFLHPREMRADFRGALWPVWVISWALPANACQGLLCPF